MDRESLLSGCNEYSDNDLVKVEAVKIVINMMCDDFESRTCENCKHCENVGLILDPYLKCYNEKSEQYDFKTSKDFGCNKFERKQ